MLRNLVLSRQYFLVQFAGLWVFKGQTSTEHGVEDDSAWPDVHKECLILLFAFDHLRCSIAGRATGSLEPLIFFIGVGESEVDNSNGVIVVKEQVFWLEISVDDVEFMDVLDAADDLLKESASLLFGYSWSYCKGTSFCPRCSRRASPSACTPSLGTAASESQLSMLPHPRTSYNCMMFGCRISFKMWIYRLTLSTSATSIILSFSRIFIATF